MRTLEIQTEAKTQVINVTEQLVGLVKGVEDGLAFFSLPHTTATLLVCEDDEELRNDLVKVAENWLVNLRPFTHIRRNNPNTEAHVLSAFGGTSVTLAIEDGKLDLGNYQNVILLELDGPKKRKIRCRVLPSMGV
jgi:secondary thiamine-phosphate synthase enzyme